MPDQTTTTGWVTHWSTPNTRAYWFPSSGTATNYVIDWPTASQWTWWTSTTATTGNRPAEEPEVLRQRRAARARARENQRVVNERARSLLMSLLSPENQDRLTRNRSIVIRGSEGGRYEIGIHGCTGNVTQKANDGEQDVKLCAHPLTRTPDGILPQFDVMISQMFSLVTDERAFLAVANRW